jgi:hypothetical protein
MIFKHPCRKSAIAKVLISILSALVSAGVSLADKPLSAVHAEFEHDILPILTAHCLKCHSAGKPKGGLDLRTVDRATKGGTSGPALIPGSADKSLLIGKITAGEMPPGKVKLAESEVRLLRQWIDAGAPAAKSAITAAVRGESLSRSEHWAFRPPARPAIPVVREGGRVRNAVDAFLLAKLQANGLGFSADAERTTLLRRAYFDLIGLPPSPDDVSAFLADGRLDAYERLLDRLLSSPHFGERWGRHWLDVVGYADTVGFDGDSNNIIMSEGKWRYRDYVIDAFNSDVPFNRFVTEQLAGDELVDWRNATSYSPETRKLLIATGFLRTARDQSHEPESNIPLSYYGVLHDTVSIVGNSLLGLTLGCAQCHDHKFDPITQKDYYRLMAVFTPAYNPSDWRPVFPWKAGINDRGIPDVAPPERAKIDRHNLQIDTQISALNKEIKDTLRPLETRLHDAKLARLPEAIRADTAAAVQTPPAKRTEVQRYLAGKFEKSLRVTPEEVTAALGDAEKGVVDRHRAQIANLEAGRQKYGKIQALYDVGPAPPTCLLKRGNYETPGEEVQPGFPSVLCDRAELSAGSKVSSRSSGRRLALARWLTEPNSQASALLERVMVNRLWLHTFGRGLVPSPENFGLSGEPPSHPELLEFLSSEFSRTGWRVKPMLKLLMTSTAYRQTSRPEPADKSADPSRVDPSNSLYWRMPLRRLEAEAIRDAVLTVSGELDPTRGGPPILTRANADGMVTVDKKALASPTAGNRRSVYLLFRRAYNLSFLSVFDEPLVAINCPRRDASAVALQSLTMLNDAFVADQAKHFALRVARAEAVSDERAIQLAYRLALTREPDAAEMTICKQLLARQRKAFRSGGRSERDARTSALESLCHAIFNTSEFLYVE